MKWADIVALALTCKENAYKVQYCRHAKVRVEVYRTTGVAVNNIEWNHKLLRANSKFARLDILRRIGRRNTRHKLCFGCVCYVPAVGRGLWGGQQKFAGRNVALKEAHALGPRCRRCVDREKFKAQATIADYRRLQLAVAKF
jgi:hypothetical protein